MLITTCNHLQRHHVFIILQSGYHTVLDSQHFPKESKTTNDQKIHILHAYAGNYYRSVNAFFKLLILEWSNAQVVRPQICSGWTSWISQCRKQTASSITMEQRVKNPHPVSIYSSTRHGLYRKCELQHYSL